MRREIKKPELVVIKTNRDEVNRKRTKEMTQQIKIDENFKAENELSYIVSH